jgi:outer membrane protein TolC
VLSWSLFEGFNKQYQVISAKAQQRIAAQQLKQQQINIMGDVWSSFYTYKSSLKQVASAQASVDAAQEAYNAVQSAYDSKVGNITDLLNAQNLLAVARQQLIDSQALLATSIARLAHSTGALTNNIPPDLLGEIARQDETK